MKKTNEIVAVNSKFYSSLSLEELEQRLELGCWLDGVCTQCTVDCGTVCSTDCSAVCQSECASVCTVQCGTKT